jgi:DNA-binding CsgD family transcriptional regulator/sugar-specific transcriptional regulator TrmB
VDNSVEIRALVRDLMLQEVDLATYRWILRHGSICAHRAAADLALTREQAEASIQRLIDARLVRRDPEDASVGFAVAPEAALAHLSAPLEARIREDQQRVAVLREELDRFTEPYHQRSAAGSDSYVVIQSLDEVRDALNKASDSCQHEMISCQPGGGARVPAAMEEAIHRDRRLLERGVTMRTLYHHTARFNAPSQAYVAIASALGAEYRTAHALFGRVIAFDRNVAFLPLQDDSLGAVVVREPNTVGYLCDIFEQAWEVAEPFVDAASEGLEQVSKEVHETLIRMLAAGLKDETIARRLGMSLRTARRHIAEIMQELNATSRFQAGVAAAQKGLHLPSEARPS